MNAPQVTCPTSDQFRAFGLGEKADPATVEFVSQHLETCDTCCEAAATVSADGFLDRRRAADQPDGTPIPPGSLSGVARSIVTRPSGSRPHAASGADSIPPGLADNPDYEIVRELGRGGMGWCTWRGTS